MFGWLSFSIPVLKSSTCSCSTETLVHLVIQKKMVIKLKVPKYDSTIVKTKHNGSARF